jgi:hypothetical protein
MLLSAVKFQEAVRIDNKENTFLNEMNDGVEMFLDLKTNLLALKSKKEVVFVPVTNVLWMKKKDEVAPKV